MKERPILFTPANAQLIVLGRKTQTRRAIAFPKTFKCPVTKQRYPLPVELWKPTIIGGYGTFRIVKGEKISVPETGGMWNDKGATLIGCPYGFPGDRLWVKEGFITRNSGNTIVYRSDYTQQYGAPEAAGFGAMYGGWKSPLFMPRKYARLILNITEIRIERLHDISEEDALAEGIDDVWLVKEHIAPPRRRAYFYLWDSINGVHSHKENPWVWCLSFRRIDG